MFINDLFNDKDKTLNEVSNELLGRYKKAAGADASAADKRGDIERGNKRFSGIVKATKKQLAHDVASHKKFDVNEQTPQYTPKGVPLKQPTAQAPLNVPQGWQATTQPDGSTRISKQGSMSSAEYKQNMADYKAKNWTPEKIADYGQRMASGQGYTDAERQANLQQQQQHFGKYADTGDLKETEPTTNQPRTTMSDERKAQLRKDINAVDYNKEQQPLAAPSPEQKASIRQAVSDYNKEKVKEQDDFPNEKTLKQQEQDRWSHYDAAKKAAQGEILGREVDGKVISIPPGHPEYDETFDDLYRQQNPGYNTPNDPGFYLTPFRYPGEPEPAYTKALVEGGPFSYGAKKPRKGSVTDLAAKKRKEQEKDKQPAEPRDHMVGVARVVKDVSEVSKTTLDRYVPAAVTAHGHADFSARQSKDDPNLRSYHKDQKHTAEKRRQGISRALDRMSKTEGMAEGQFQDEYPEYGGKNPNKTMFYDRNVGDYKGEPWSDAADNWSGDKPTYADSTYEPDPVVFTLPDGSTKEFAPDDPFVKQYRDKKYGIQSKADQITKAFTQAANTNAARPNLATSDSTNDFTDPVKLGQYDVDFPEKTIDKFNAQTGQITQKVIPSPNNPNAPLQKPAPIAVPDADSLKAGEKIEPSSKPKLDQKQPVVPISPKAPSSNTAPITARPKSGSWQELAQLNKITDPRKLQAGTRIKTPDGGSVYVNKGDTLSGIAQKIRRQGVAEGKKPDSYHIVNKDGKPATLASYADRASAEKDRDAKHPGAEVRQLGPRGKVKGVSESGHGRNRGYEPGFASPHAPSLGGRRERDEPDAVNNIEISINGRVWKIFAGKGPDRSREFFQQKQAVDTMCKRKTAETGKEWSWGVTGAAATNEGTKCNMTEEGRSCPEHGIMECPGYSRLMGEAFKMPPESVQDKMHRRHQELRKKSGLPDPEHYLKLKKQKEQELAALRAEIEQDRAKGLDEAEERYLEELQRAGYDIITEKKIRQRLDPKCWKGKHKEGTKIKGGVRVNNCVPNK